MIPYEGWDREYQQNKDEYLELFDDFMSQSNYENCEQFEKEFHKNTKGKDPQDPFGIEETRDPFEINPISTGFQIDSLVCTKKHKERERDFK